MVLLSFLQRLNIINTYIVRSFVLRIHDIIFGIHWWLFSVHEYIVSYTQACETNPGCLRSIYPSLGMRQFFGDVTMGQWRHNYDPFMWPNHPLEVIGIYVHINTQSKESLTQICRRLINVHCVWYFCTYLYDLSLNWWHALFCIANDRHGVTITTHAIKRHYLIWMTTVRQPSKRRCSCVLT